MCVCVSVFIVGKGRKNAEIEKNKKNKGIEKKSRKKIVCVCGCIRDHTLTVLPWV